MEEDPDLVLKVHSLLAEGKPDVLAYAAQLGDEHVIREYLKNFPNEVFTDKVHVYNNVSWCLLQKTVHIKHVATQLPLGIVTPCTCAHVHGVE